MGKEERTAIWEAQGKRNAVVAAAIVKVIAFRPAMVIDLGIDGIFWRGGCQNIGEERFIPASQLKVHAPAVVGAPMPVEQVHAATGVPVEFGVLPEPVYPVSKFGLFGSGCVE